MRVRQGIWIRVALRGLVCGYLSLAGYKLDTDAIVYQSLRYDLRNPGGLLPSANCRSNSHRLEIWIRGLPSRANRSCHLSFCKSV